MIVSITKSHLVREIILPHSGIGGILILMGALYLIFPFHLHNMETYVYASSIERYYDISATFTLGQDAPHLVNFGRYHLNHPIGHVLAAWIHDYIGMSVLTWLRFLNGFSSLAAGLAFYQVLLQINYTRAIAAIGVATLLASNSIWESALSGEWHMPALALMMAGLWQIEKYLRTRRRANLVFATGFVTLSIGYHLIWFFLTPLVLAAFLISQRRNVRWGDISIAAVILSLFLLIIYVILPFIIYRFENFSEFLQTFLVYKNISHIRYEGLTWLQNSLRTILHTFIFSLGATFSLDIVALFFYPAIGLLAIFYFRPTGSSFLRILTILAVVLSLLLHALLGARPDGINGWMGLVPFLIIVFLHPLSRFAGRKSLLSLAIPAILLIWNFYNGIYMNTFKDSHAIFFSQFPRGTQKDTPILFMIDNPVLGLPEIWYVGSVLGFRKQAHFFPRFSDWKRMRLFHKTMEQNPGFILIREGNPNEANSLLSAHGFRYKMFVNERALWPETLVPATIFIRRPKPFGYVKRLSVWIPDQGVSRP
jgi:hypothetical protein